MNDRAGIIALAAVVLIALSSCLLVDALLNGHYFLTEFAIGCLAVAWLTLAAGDLLRSRALEAELARRSTPRIWRHIAWYATPGLEHDAIVAGVLQPRIYIGLEFVERLSEVELEAVLSHEDYHRRTRAPLRAAALAAWLVLFGRIGIVRRILVARLAALEIAADHHALRRGSSGRVLARALLKSERRGLTPVAFSHVATLRIEHLVGMMTNVPDPVGPTVVRLRYEWMPISALALAAVGCQYLA